ncbi:MAG: HAD-IA family hydrolase [Actinomycetia bacterium]|nr:HAD-IA family hydrolase [Actinomycetes bacterium]
MGGAARVWSEWWGMQAGGWRKDVVLFDFDGTLMDSAALVRESTHYALRAVLGLDVEDARLRPYFGRLLEDQFRELVPDADAATLERLLMTYRAHQAARHDQAVRPCPGAVETVRRLAAAGLRLAVVSSKRRALLRRGLAALGLEGAFHAVVDADSTTRHKPDPEPVRLALSLLGDPPPARAVMVGDSPYDMAAATAAGVTAVAVRTPGFTAAELRAAGAAAVLADLRDFVHWLQQREEAGPA